MDDEEPTLTAEYYPGAACTAGTSCTADDGAKLENLLNKLASLHLDKDASVKSEDYDVAKTIDVYIHIDMREHEYKDRHCPTREINKFMVSTSFFLS